MENKAQILIVDDDEIVLRILEKVLTKAGHVILLAANGEDALIQSRNHPDLILLDLQLPDMSGFEICQAIKSREDTKDIPIIMITSDVSSESLEIAFKAGAIDYIVKPSKKIELMARINSALSLKHEQDVRKSREKELKTLSEKLSKYLSPQVYDSIFTGKQDVKLKTKRKLLTIFFSDIVGFTQMADVLDPEELTDMLNEYLDEMSKIALKYGGTIDKFIGDALMIFFGDPESKGERQDALNCVNMSIEMRNRLNYLCRSWSSRLCNGLKIRMGINTGRCMVGNFGTSNRLEYTIIGSEVNLASRLETVANPNQIVISERTYLLVKDQIACRKLKPKNVKGLFQPIQTYEVINTFDNLNNFKYEMTEKTEGFSIYVDFNCIDKIKALELIGKVTKQLENHELKNPQFPNRHLVE
ncbi:MAG: adenylate/guanylate cyclase domain-containing response regulator [Proteobacteria bacterium]|nr:adenylate/guanylate cyclase domain-containing response regulator [Pseudomonadota bacterium]